MVELTVGYVSGIIAAGVNLVQFFIPMLSTLILAGLLGEENSLATWTQAGRALQSSHWPLLMRADESTSGVSRLVRFEGIFRPLALLIVALAAVITPLGLYEKVVPSETTVPEPFSYQEDTSPFGFGTPARSNLGLNRVCGNYLPAVCPGSDTVIETTRTKSNLTMELPNSYDIHVPDNLVKTYQSGLDDLDSTVSSLFDIDWRSYSIRISNNTNNRSEYAVGNYRQLEMLLLKDGVQLVEGLIVDNKNGGIGFRNHTIPSPLEYGGIWSEDLLFVEPSTQCVNTNLTVDYTIPLDSGYKMEDVVLTDRGGFVDLNTTYPSYDHDNAQKNPDLQGRAYKAAFLHNAYTMAFLNITNIKTNDSDLPAFSYLNSTKDKNIPVDFYNNVDPTKLAMSDNFKLYSGLPSSPGERALSLSTSRNYSNPFNVSDEDYSGIKITCQGAGGIDYGNITNIGVRCGFVFGAARPLDGSPSLVLGPGSRWSSKMYTCASATRAVVKTVKFRYNGTDELNSLHVVDIRDKIYAKDSDKPYWAVEKTGMELQDALPLWGLVSEKYKDSKNISVIQNESLWLPGYKDKKSTTPYVGTMNLAGVSFHVDALAAVYGMGSSVTNDLSVDDYSGGTNLALYARWQKLSKNVDGAASIINQVWTDVAANAVVGTRSWLGPRKGTQFAKRDGDDEKSKPRKGQIVNVPVTVYNRRIGYHLPYGIPAFIVLLITVSFAAAACVLGVAGRTRPSTMRQRLFDTAPGRIMGSLLYPGQIHSQAPTKQWSRTIGAKKVTFADSVPRASDPIMMGGHVYVNGSNASIDDPLFLKESASASSPGFQQPFPPPPQQAHQQPQYNQYQYNPGAYPQR